MGHKHTVLVASGGVVDRPTQLICISDIYLCQQTNTKDIAGQSARGGVMRLTIAQKKFFPPPAAGNQAGNCAEKKGHS